MSDSNNSNNGGGWSGFWIALALLSIAFYGEPDLVTSIIEYLQSEAH